mmetsp:Transcript_17514/g.20904  ORF Transcript_17514/g.20904 Transcript_17514/m.20904 type:complete len:86 (+) Transcript_17514:212-469(+)
MSQTKYPRLLPYSLISPVHCFVHAHGKCNQPPDAKPTTPPPIWPPYTSPPPISIQKPIISQQILPPEDKFYVLQLISHNRHVPPL